MPLPLTPQQQQLIKSMLLFEIPYAHTAEAAKCTERQVHRIKANLLQYNTVCAPKALIQGQKWKITEEMEEVSTFKLQYLYLY